MENIKKFKDLIENRKSIVVLYNKAKGEDAISSAISLFYALEDKVIQILPKENVPDNIKEVIKSPDPICGDYYVMTIKSENKDIESIFYEKTNNILKIFIAVKNDSLNKDDIEIEKIERICENPEAVIAIGFDNADIYNKEAQKNNIKFPKEIISINNNTDSQLFGTINILVDKTFSICELTTFIIKNFSENVIDKQIANSLLYGILSFNKNDKKDMKTKTLEVISYLIKRGADYNEILSKIK